MVDIARLSCFFVEADVAARHKPDKVGFPFDDGQPQFQLARRVAQGHPFGFLLLFLILIAPASPKSRNGIDIRCLIPRLVRAKTSDEPLILTSQIQLSLFIEDAKFDKELHPQRRMSGKGERTSIPCTKTNCVHLPEDDCCLLYATQLIAESFLGCRNVNRFCLTAPLANPTKPFFLFRAHASTSFVCI